MANIQDAKTAFDTFDISLHGQGTHGAMPHQGSDLLVAASQLNVQLQTIVLVPSTR